MNRLFRHSGLGLTLSILLLASCAPTARLIEGWGPPPNLPPAPERVIVFAVGVAPGQRRIVEDAAVETFGPSAESSYKYLPTDTKEEMPLENLMSRLPEPSSILTIRPIGSRTETNITTVGSAGFGFRGYCQFYRCGGFGSTTIRVETIRAFEANLYTIPEGGLRWSGTFETRSREKLSDVSRAVTRGAKEELLNRKVLTPST
ncbi:MAG: hypothetical protein ACFB9M_02280 [Myxococcota bacterium]